MTCRKSHGTLGLSCRGRAVRCFLGALVLLVAILDDLMHINTTRIPRVLDNEVMQDVYRQAYGSSRGLF